MKRIIWLVLIALHCLYFVGYAQNSRDAKVEKKDISEANLGHTYSKRKRNKKADHSYSRVFDQKIKEFEIRMKTAAKEKKLAEREMRKPQYSDPSYFGHKRKPKKRPPGKKKFCKECGLYH